VRQGICIRQLQERRGYRFVRRRWELPTPREALELGGRTWCLHDRSGEPAHPLAHFAVHAAVLSVSTGVRLWEAVERLAALASLSCVGPASSAVRARRSSVLWVCAALTRVVLPCGGGVSRIGAYVRMRMQRLVPALERHAVRVRTD
jgi:hypothetical protein